MNDEITALEALLNAFTEFCCDNCISEVDLENDSPELLDACKKADELITQKRTPSEEPAQ